MSVKPSESIRNALVPIWQRVLRCPYVGVHDDFFELGGDSLLAVELFTEIARVYGRELPAIVIYEAPTIAQLAVLLERNNAPGFPPLVTLRSGTQSPPVFVTHGLGGSVVDFFQMIRNLNTNHSLYGMQAKGIDGVEQPFEHIEDMAEYYLHAVRLIQPQGPYLFVGFSLGGLVTLEMARRLSQKGEKIGLLAMLDSYPHPRFIPRLRRTLLRVQLLRRHLSVARRLPLSQAYEYLARRSERRSQAPAGQNGNQSSAPSSRSSAMQRVREAASLALTRYRPPVYHGKVKFVRAEATSDFPNNAGAVWKRYIPNLEIETIPGDHIGIMTKYADRLARAVSHYLEEAEL